MKYTVTQAIQLPTGTLVRIGKEKALRHAAQLAERKGNQYECLEPVWIKAGEVIDLDNPAKHLLPHLEAFDKTAAKKAAAAAELAEAKAREAAEAQAASDADLAEALAEQQAKETAAADTAPGSLLPAHS